RTAQRSIVRFEAITRDQQAIHVVHEAGVDDPFEGDQRGFFDELLGRGSNAVGRGKSSPVQLMIEQEARRVNTAKRIHHPDGSVRGRHWPEWGECTPDRFLRKPRIWPIMTGLAVQNSD